MAIFQTLFSPAAALLLSFAFGFTTNTFFPPPQIHLSPISPVCSTDSVSCSATVSYSFSVEADQAEGLTVSHQLKISDQAPQADPYGTITGVYPNYALSGEYPVGEYTLILSAIGY